MFNCNAPGQMLKLRQPLTVALGLRLPALQAFPPHLATALGFGDLVKFAQ